MQIAYNALDLLGRILLAAFFIPAGIHKIFGYTGTAAAMASQGIPGALLPLVILLEVVGGAALLFGWRTQIAAFLLAGFTFLAVWFFHIDANGMGQMAMPEIAVGGGLLAFAAHGAAQWSVDALRKR